MTTWAIQTTWSGDGDLSGICYSPSLDLYLATGTKASGSPGSHAITSPDLVTWTDRGLAGFSSITGVTLIRCCWADTLGLFVLCGTGISSGDPTISTSPNGTAYTTRGNPFGTNGSNPSIGTGVAWSNFQGLLVAVGSGARGTGNGVAHSTTGTTWTGVATDLDYDTLAAGANSQRGIAYSPDLDLWCAVGFSAAAGSIITSPDATTWTSRLTGSAYVDVIWSTIISKFVAVGPDGIAYSADGSTWSQPVTAFTGGQPNAIYGVFECPGAPTPVIYACGANSIGTVTLLGSYEGQVWWADTDPFMVPQLANNTNRRCASGMWAGADSVAVCVGRGHDSISPNFAHMLVTGVPVKSARSQAIRRV